MRNNILPTSVQYNTSALLCGMTKHTSAEAGIDLRDLLIVGELEGAEDMVMLVLVYLHRATGRLFTKPEVIAKTVLAQLEADGTQFYSVA